MQNPSTMPGQPQLGTPVPGTTGGLPALSGLSVTKNPMAQELQSYGRGDDSMLVHMTPAEVNSLQGLAMAHGGSLTINPHTGLPEAGWLGRLLPTILGAVGMAFGIPPVWMGAAGAIGGTIATGDLGKGLSMGLQAYGGASLGGAAGIGGKLGSVGQSLGLSGSSAIGGASAASGAGNLLGGNTTPFGGFLDAGTTAAKSSGALGGFANAAKAGAGFLGNKAPLLAGAGVLSGLSEASKPNLPTYKPEESSLKYTPMAGLQRKVRFQTPEQMEASGGAEYQYFTPVNPEPMPLSQVQQTEPVEGFADGGEAAASMIPATPATPAAPAGFNELVAAYNANNPGAITASMNYPASAPAPAAEQKYNFRPTAPTPVAPTPGTGLGGIDLSGLNLGNYDFSNINIPGFDWGTIRDNLDIDRIQQQLQQQNLQSPTLNIEAPDLSGIYGRLDELDSRMQSLPTELPTYQVPDLLGIYGRLDELGSRVQSVPTELPTYQAPDLSGIYGRLDELGSRVQSVPTELPTYQAPDLSGIYGRLDELGSRVQSLPTELPTYQAPDLSGIYGRLDELGSRVQSLPTQQPTYQAPDLSGIYDRFGQLESRINSLPTYQAPDLSGLYNRFDTLESRINSLPTYQEPTSYFDSYRTFDGFAHGGAVDMRDGAFVVDARTVSELGNGSSNAGMELLSRMGGKPVRGPGDGVSDSVPASIGGKQKARVARDEVIFQPDAVRRIGGGSEKRGTQKLYALMDKAHKARKNAKRGQDTGIRRGLA